MGKNEAAKAARTRAPPTEQELEAKQEEAKRNILLIAGGGTLASTAFFYKNLQRLFTKVSTGGQDSGYGSAKDLKYRKQAAKKPKGKAAKAAPKASAGENANKVFK